MKELNIIEAIKMPIGTEFEVILDGQKYNMKAKIIGEKQLVWDNRAYIEIIINDSIINAKFIPIQKSVSFMEAIADDKNMIKVILDCNAFFSSDIEYFNNYMTINTLFKMLSERFKSHGILKAINEGKWYIKQD